MKIFSYKQHKIPKSYVVIASSYKREIPKEEQNKYDFSLNALKEQYTYESKGTGKPDKMKNGYTYGKWMYDITISDLKDSIEKGYFVIDELLKGSSYRKRQFIKKFGRVNKEMLEMYNKGKEHYINSLIDIENHITSAFTKSAYITSKEFNLDK